MRGLVNHEKRNLLAITLVYTIVICFILQYVIANDISGTADQINNFYGGIYNDYGNLFLGTLDQYYKMFIIVLMIPISFVAVIQYRESSTSKCGEFLMPVSYTHLDVYKRQVKENLKPCVYKLWDLFI